ncbi:MAG: hypothetical protein OHK005_08010 [Candidatus Methylacidiphilales bacterium]
MNPFVVSLTGCLLALSPLHASPPAPASQTTPETLHWFSSLPEAEAAAKRQKKPMLLLFTGSDWCSWCKRLQKEVLASPMFRQFARERLILMEIDFPRLKPMPLEQHHANLMLAERFGVLGFPTLILLNEQGNKLEEFGFPKGGAESLVSRIEAALNTASLNSPNASKTASSPAK